jgi:hypothetical protein
VDNRHDIERAESWDDADDARGWLADRFRLDRTAGQPWTTVLAAQFVPLSCHVTCCEIARDRSGSVSAGQMWWARGDLNPHVLTDTRT